MKSENRIHYLDNLRTFAVLSVVFHHCAVPYAPGIGAAGWHIVPDAVKHPIFSWVVEYTDLYQMPLLFFVAGYVAVLGLEKRGGKAFYHRPSVRSEHPLLKVQSERLGLYFGMFLLGATYQKRQSLKPSNGDHPGKHWIAICLVVLVAFSLIWHSALTYGAITGNPMRFFLLHSTTNVVRAFSAVFLLLFVFKSVLNRTGGLQPMLNRNSYGVYIIHYLLMAVVFIAVQSAKSAIPGPLAQFAVVFALTVLLANGVVHMGRKI